MPEIVIENLDSKTIHCTGKTERLLDILLSATDWMHTCGGKGKCTTCAAVITSGREHLSELAESEKGFIKLGRLRSGERQTCQVKVHGDVRLRVPDRYKLPHLTYSE